MRPGPTTPAPGFSVEDAYHDHAGVLYGFAVHALGDRQAAEDLVQEVYLRAWRASSSFDADRASVRTWLFAIARNLVLDAHRTSARRPRTAQQQEDLAGVAEAARPGPEDEVVERLRMAEALARLSPEHRQVLDAVHLRGCSYAELASVTGVPVATLRTRMYHGLRAVRAVLAEQEGTEAGGTHG